MNLQRVLFQLFLYIIIIALLALYLDARLQMTQYQDQKERLCTAMSTITSSTPDLYAICTVNPGSWFQQFAK